MKICFIIEICLLVAACVTAVIVTIKNARLRKTIVQRDRSIKELREIIYKEMEMRVKIESERDSWKAECSKLRCFVDKARSLVATNPELMENESDAHYHQRCRQSVANKAAKYAKVGENITTLIVIKP